MEVSTNDSTDEIVNGMDLNAGPPQLSVSVERTHSDIVIRLGGELDIAVRGLVGSTVQDALALREGRVKTVHLDVTNVSFIDSSGLHSLMTACETIRERGLAFALVVDQNGPVGDLLRITGIGKWFGARERPA